MKNKNKFIIIVTALVVAIIAIISIICAIAAHNRPTATAGSVYPDAPSLQTYYNNQQYSLKTLPTLFGFTDEQANSVLNDKGLWNAYTLEIAVDNKSKDNITIYTFEVKNNGKNNVWLSTVSNGDVGIVSGNKETISISALVKGKDISADDAAKAIKKYSIKIVYSKTPTENSEGVDSIETHKTITVK